MNQLQVNRFLPIWPANKLISFAPEYGKDKQSLLDHIAPIVKENKELQLSKFTF